MNMGMNNEAKTGLIVLVSAALLGGLILKVGNFTVLKEGYSVKAQFKFAAGVKKHAPVRLSGVDVGEVKDINILYGDETMVETVLWLQDGVKVRLDAVAYVTMLGMMGEKYIEIRAGTSQTEWAKDGDAIQSEETLRLEDLLATATKVGDDISKMAKDISHMTQRIDETVAENKPRIDQIFINLEETSDNFNAFSEDLRYHPWKVLAKGKEKPREEIEKDRAARRAAKEKAAAAAKEKAAAAAKG